MATTDDVERRVKETDSSRTAQRAAAAKQILVLAQRQAAIADQLATVERELGETIADATEVITVAELATFTDLPATDLTRWLDHRKPSRAKRKKPTNTTPRSTRSAIPTAAAETRSLTTSSAEREHAVADEPAGTPIVAGGH